MPDNGIPARLRTWRTRAVTAAPELLAAGGAGAVTTGAALLAPSAGWGVGGLFAMGAAWLIATDRARAGGGR
ncbi:hypothetical protein JOD54_000838 [Actinokineospora baliensis]|uniref:hypothetical protein n=1 Tax=Actinokineospora baliensis TaxID=547056 RepID=UPI001958E7A8|nr:hypothetical protein [Actinokineospora baliensis]MBM7770634.1 hypothetical protein [Actinokineospora baliensis]